MINNQIILNDLKQILNNNFIGLIYNIILFGSQINGKYKEYSDYDFYTEFEEIQVKRMYEEVKIFINEIIKFIKE